MDEEIKQQNRILDVDIEQEMKKSFISYSMAVIISRALPDVRDGLKPVHRRIIYSMHELGLTSDKPYAKSARIVGDAMGKYHPHGDAAIYDALVRLGQPFSTRYMLVDGQGNFGSVDGDPPAAMRYTEARMSRIAAEMVADLDKDTVDFIPNFDDKLLQPAVMPCRFPNLLVNGCGGIAVGMTTNIPPHNLREVVQGLQAMIDDPDITSDELMQYIKGPDFPTYGIITGLQGIRDTYRTGRGRMTVRARAEIEELSGGRSRIIVNELPYQVNKARMIEHMSDLIHDGVIDGISNIVDESNMDKGIRIVIDVKREFSPNVVLSQLYKHTEMQSTFSAIMLALVDGAPRILDLRSILYYYLEHQRDVVTRRTKNELNRARARAHILEGLLRALDVIDEIIALIRASKTAQEAREGLMGQFGFTEEQARAILDMRLQRLTGLERDRLLEEYNGLVARIEYLESLLADEHKLMGVVRDELGEIADKYGDDRRTEITAAENDIELADLIEEHDVVITMTHMGYIKRLPAATYRAQRRGGKGIAALSKRDEDFVERIFVTSTHQPIMFFTNRGKVYRMNVYELPEAARTARGTPIVNYLPLDAGEVVTTMFPVPNVDTDARLIMCTEKGVIKRVRLSEFGNIRKTGLIALYLREDDELRSVALTFDDEDDIIVGSRQGNAVRFPQSDVRIMGRAAAGVRAINLDGDDKVIDMQIIPAGVDLLTISDNGFGKRSSPDEFRRTARGGKGVRAMMLTDKTGLLACLKTVTDGQDIMIISEDGTVIRMQSDDIKTQGRSTQGVTLMRGDIKVAAVAITEHEEPEEDADEAEEAAETEE